MGGKKPYEECQMELQEDLTKRKVGKGQVPEVMIPILKSPKDITGQKEQRR
jgi:hypothetical protein